MSNDDAAAGDATTSVTSRATLTFTEVICPGLKLEMDLKKIMASEESEYQKVDVIETVFGKVRVENKRKRCFLAHSRCSI